MNFNLKHEPVRKYLYSVGVAGIALLVAYGLIQNEDVTLWIAAVAAILGVPVTEVTRAKVVPVRKLEENAIPPDFEEDYYLLDEDYEVVPDDQERADSEASSNP